ncbi:MAG: hypothetical protein A2035_00615 [Nitrospirae bacterium GWA2_42_11]|nr:MAG: hypothetical protein A2035_00615 [Nitrospirae bacterium GWA2_42_11]
MNKISFTLSTIFCMLLTACSHVKEIKTLPSLSLEKVVISRGIDIKDNTAIPLNPTLTFSTEDREVIASVKLTNLTGRHLLRWDWIDPEDKLYYSTDDYPLNTPEGKYKEEVSAWHRLSIKGDRVSEYPGDWQVNVYLDDSLIVSKDFKIEVDINTISGFGNKPDPAKWGLIIGIENYPNFPAVDFAEGDALLVKEYFIKVLGVPEENIISLLGKDATNARIRGYLKSYIPKNVEKETTLYVYYGGHGLPFPEKDGIEPYLVPYDSDTITITETGYRLRDFYSDIDNMNIKKAFIFLDTCFSGIASRGDKILMAGARPVIIHLENSIFFSGKVISFTSSSGGELSNSYPEKGHGLFTYFLLRGMRGEADIDKNDSISIEELYEYVKGNVNKLSRRKGVEQTPEIAPPLNLIKDVEVNKVREPK